MRTPRSYFCVGYKWTDAAAGDTGYGRTVVTAATQEAAEAWLQARNKHVTVVPLAQWEAERGFTDHLSARAPGAA